MFPLEASFSGWQGADGFEYGVVLRDISVRKREAGAHPLSRRIRHAHRACQPHTLPPRLAAMISPRRDRRTRGRRSLVLGLDELRAHQRPARPRLRRPGPAGRRRALEPAGRRGGTWSRGCGDEFAVAIPCADMAETGRQFAEPYRRRIRHAALGRRARAPRQAQHRRVGLSADGATADELLGAGHLALCRAKTTSRGSHRRVRTRDPRGARSAPDARGGAGAGCRARRVRAVLPAAGSARGRRAGRRRGADPLAPPGPRPGVAGRVHAGRQHLVDLGPRSRSGFWKPHAGRRAVGTGRARPCASASTFRRRRFTPATFARSVAAALAAYRARAILLELEVTEDILLPTTSGVLEIFRRSSSSASASCSTISAPAMRA